MDTKHKIARNWLPRYTGTKVDELADYILLTTFSDYIEKFSKQFDAPIKGIGRPMQTCTNKNNLTIINMGIGAASAATAIDLLSARQPKGMLFLGKCGAIKKSSALGHFVIPIAAIRAGSSAGVEWLPPEVPSLPSFKINKFVSDIVLENNMEYRSGVVYSTSRRLWEWDEDFKQYLIKIGAIAIDMETDIVFTVSYANRIPCGALLLVSDRPMTPEGVKTEKTDEFVSKAFVDIHLKIGIDSMEQIGKKGEPLKHFRYSD